MLPDTGERYLSTQLFEDIPPDMTAEEIEIHAPRRGSASTPNTAAPPCAGNRSGVAGCRAVRREVLRYHTQPVVMFALEWCEFCRRCRKLFAAYSIPYRSVDLDFGRVPARQLGW